MNLTTASVHSWARAILRQLDAPAGYTLDVTATALPPEQPAETSGAAYLSTMRVRYDGSDEAAAASRAEPEVVATLTFDDSTSVSARLDSSMAEADAVALLADQLQEGLLEETGGAPVPRCPGHAHPAAAEVVNGVASWVCPRNGAPLRPILAGPAV